MRTNFYIDGFNLYFGALVRSSSYKWLDLGRLCSRLVPRHEVTRIRYFTAPVTDRSDRPGQRQRQLTYLRALDTIPELSVHERQFAQTVAADRWLSVFKVSEERWRYLKHARKAPM